MITQLKEQLQIKKGVQQRIQSELDRKQTRLKDLPTQTVHVQSSNTSVGNVSIDVPESVFIPSDLGSSEMSGKIQVQKTTSESSTLEEAAKLLKQSKKRGKK